MTWRTSPILFLLLAVQSLVRAQETEPAPLPNVERYHALREKALSDRWSYERLADLTDLIGPRLSGTPQAQAAVDQVAGVLRAEGLRVTLQPMHAPHWLRGVETGELVDYAGRPAGITQRVQLTTLGGSVATPAEGLTAQVLVVHSFAELTAHAKEARGRIVLFDVPFDQQLADNGQPGTAYVQALMYRGGGAIAAAKLGAVAALVRAVGGANYRLTHAGQMRYDPAVTKIPSAALTVEDAALVARLAQRGKVSMKLMLTPQTLPEVDSFNVIADLVGTATPEQFVVVSGHLDSWDLGTGAIDDGAGVAVAMGVAHLFKELKLRPKRTLRVVAWMSEENGVFGGQAYFDALKADPSKHAAVIESDFGAGHAFGIEAFADPKVHDGLRSLHDVLAPIGATVLRRAEQPIGSDIGGWQTVGVPGFEALVDGRHYFDYHHTPADTLDKVDPKNLQQLLATLSVLSYYLCEAK
jgi:carboxypeptidase Q